MKRILTYFLLLLTLCSCSDKKAKLPVAKVLLIHCYNAYYADYDAYHKALEKSFIELGYNPDFRNIYLNADDDDNSAFEPLYYGYESLKGEGWFPDIILTDEDRSLRNIVKKDAKEFVLKWNVPIIAGGLHYMYRAFMPNSRVVSDLKVVAIPDSVDVNRNIDLAVKYGKSNFVFIESNTSKLETAIRVNIIREIRKRDNFVNNIDFHETRFTDPVYQEELSDSVYVTFISTQSNDRMFKHAKDKDVVMDAVKKLYSSLWAFPYIKFTQNIYSDELINKSGRPQFTAIKDCFADYSHKYLCGYFSSYETMAQDMASYAVRVLNGEKPRDIEAKPHKKAYYMDYQAMKKYGLNFNDCSTDFIIVGAPFSLSHPVLWGLTYMVLFFIVTMTVTLILVAIMSYRTKDKQEMLQRLAESEKLSALALKGANTIVVNSWEDIANGEKFIHPDSLKSFKEAIERFRRGEDDFSTLVLSNAPDMGEVYKWWEFRVGKAIEVDGERVIPALIIDVDDSVRRKHQLIEARKIAEEARAKETFIMNISHEMRTPLNAIVGFSQALSQLNDLLTDEEVRQYGRYIKDNAEVLSVMVNDILQFSRLESGRVKMVPEEVHVKELLETIIFEWQDKLNGTVGLELGDCPDDVYISADSLRLKEVIGQYIGNGLKFSSKGTVTVGCTFDSSSERAKIWVKDEGPGIPEEKLQFTFKLFWKGDAFIPGVGLGLSIAKSFTEMMGGEVSVESKVGVGSTFASEFDGYKK